MVLGQTAYHMGQILYAKALAADESIWLCPCTRWGWNPMKVLKKRHPVGSSRMGVITNKYRGDVFCRLPDGCTVVCIYAQQFSDDQFHSGDHVLIQIRSFSNDRHWLRGKIRSQIG